jgi:hypothetical protein
VYNNPVKHTDPTGHCADDDAICKAYEQWILDWTGIILEDSLWATWSADEARLVYETLYDIALKFYDDVPYKDATDLMRAAWEGVHLVRVKFTVRGGAYVPRGGAAAYFPDNGLWQDEEWTKHVIAEELGHSWDFRTSLGGDLNQAMQAYVGASWECVLLIFCNYNPGPEDPIDDYAGSKSWEDWAGSFAQFVEPSGQRGDLKQRREGFVRIQIALLVTEIDK